jgi:hypothetical protein
MNRATDSAKLLAAFLARLGCNSLRLKIVRVKDGGMNSPLLTLEDAAKLLGYTPSGLRKVVNRTREGRAGASIRFFQVGQGPIRCRQEWLDEVIDANTVSPHAASQSKAARREHTPQHLKRPG